MYRLPREGPTEQELEETPAKPGEESNTVMDLTEKSLREMSTDVPPEILENVEHAKTQSGSVGNSGLVSSTGHEKGATADTTSGMLPEHGIYQQMENQNEKSVVDLTATEHTVDKVNVIDTENSSVTEIDKDRTLQSTEHLGSDMVQSASDKTQNVTNNPDISSDIQDLKTVEQSASIPSQSHVKRPAEPEELEPLPMKRTRTEDVQEERQPIENMDECIYEQKLDFTKVPQEVAGAFSAFKTTPSNYFKGCKWSPDGTCVLTNSEDRCLRIFNLPEELYDVEGNKTVEKEMMPAVKIHEGELIYDYCWYPRMHSQDPASCCLISTSRDTPVHMWDGFDGELRCSYRAFNHVDDMVAAQSVTFSNDGQKIYCGFEKMIRIFDVSRPGRQCVQKQTYAKGEGQTGILSCIAMSPLGDSYAVGSYAKSIAIYSMSDNKLQFVFEGQQGGVTHLQYAPSGNELYSGGRKDPEILCWDIRNPGRILYVFEREVETNQRIYFDLDSTGKYVVSGNHNGMVSVWDTTQESEMTVQPCMYWRAHTETVNGISIHPSLPLLATTSGQRHFTLPYDEDDSDDEEDENKENDIKQLDNSLRLWKI